MAIATIFTKRLKQGIRYFTATDEGSSRSIPTASQTERTPENFLSLSNSIEMGQKR